MTRMLSSLAQGRLAVLLEGGYNLESISHSMAMCAKALLSDPLPPLANTGQLNPAAVDTIRRIVRHQSPYWTSLSFHVDLPEADDVLSATSGVEDQLVKLELCQAPESPELAEASGVTSSDRPKTLQEFLLMPENVEAMSAGTFFSVVPMDWCPHLDGHIRPDADGPCWQLDSLCSTCHDPSENWICLSCFQVLD